jgi:hypothetical protein
MREYSTGEPETSSAHWTDTYWPTPSVSVVTALSRWLAGTAAASRRNLHERRYIRGERRLTRLSQGLLKRCRRLLSAVARSPC